MMKETESRGIELPKDMLEAAKTTGIRQVFLERYLELQVRFNIINMLYMLKPIDLIFD